MAKENSNELDKESGSRAHGGTELKINKLSQNDTVANEVSYSRKEYTVFS